MTVGLPELSKFQIKADAYRRALQIAPYARSIEVVPMLAYLKGLCETLGIPRRKLRIVDFMSGDGHLSRILYGQGYRQIQAIESCNEMSFDSEIYEKIRFANAPDAVLALRVVEQFNPHVVVSLAAFHHLIESGDDKTIDIPRSVTLQTEIVSESFRAAPSLRLFFIVDLSTATRGKWEIDRFRLWSPLSRRQAKALDRRHFDKLSGVYAAPTFADFRGAVDRSFLRQLNSFSIPWFREVVDTKTEIGHKDVAISDHLLDRLSLEFTVSHKNFVCPWHFDGDEQLGAFLHQKFGFSIGSLDSPPHAVLELARQRRLVVAHNGLESFLWDLGITIIERPSLRLRRRNVLDRYYIFPLSSLLLALMFGALMLYDTTANLTSWIFSAWCVAFGATVKTIIAEKTAPGPA